MGSPPLGALNRRSPTLQSGMLPLNLYNLYLHGRCVAVATGRCHAELTVCSMLCLYRNCSADSLAHDIFTQVGEKLQKQRLKDFIKNFGSHLTDEYRCVQPLDY